MMTSIITSACSAMLLCATQPPELDRPEAILMAEQMRASFDHAQIEWEVDFHGGLDCPGRTEKTLFMTSKYADGDQLLIVHGNRDGCRMPEELGEPWSCSEERFLVKEGQQWLYLEDTNEASVQGRWDGPNGPEGMPMMDIRVLGFTPFCSPVSLDNYMTRYFKATSYSTSQDGDLLVVTQHVDVGGDDTYVNQWWIDPSKGWSPVRVEQIYNGSVGRRMIAEYREYEGVWFPERATFYREGEKQLTITTLFASFNNPDLVPDLGLKDLDLPPGVLLLEPDKPVEIWDGQTGIDWKEYFRRSKDGSIDLKRIVEMDRKNKTPEGDGRFPKKRSVEYPVSLSRVSGEPGLWVEYVRWFISRHEFNKDQSRKAWELLAECQEPAYKHLRKHKKTIEELDAQHEKLLAERDQGEAWKRQMAKVRRSQERMREPINKIFQEHLKPVLKKLIGWRKKDDGARGAAPPDPSSASTNTPTTTPKP